MTTDRSAEETTVFAIYSTRRDAQVAKDHLRDAGIEAFVQTDDAGGMYPQLQRPHGVKLVGMSSAAQDAYEALADAGLLPETVDERPAAPEEERGEDEPLPTLSMKGAAGLLGVVAIVLILLYLILG